MDNANETVQMQIYTTFEKRKAFQLLCIANNTDMTKAVNKFIDLCLSEKKLNVI